MSRHYVPAGGSSGSSVRNQNYELVGIFHAANSSANAGLPLHLDQKDMIIKVYMDLIIYFNMI
ncbi:DUF31 family putative serine protease [Mycoplasmopsis cynos]|uniref:DUF31 family putative serine protease n=1 Tax=Mycoplasmopsis cynos TaxID=171284 RepID=UPI003A5C8110